MSHFRAFECRTKEDLMRRLKSKVNIGQLASPSTPTTLSAIKEAARSPLNVCNSPRTPLGRIDNRSVEAYRSVKSSTSQLTNRRVSVLNRKDQLSTPFTPKPLPVSAQTSQAPATPKKPVGIISKYAALLKTPESDSDDEESTVDCKVCGVVFPLNPKDTQCTTKFRKHAIYHAPINTMHCLLCDEMHCRRQEVMKEHLRKAHDQFVTIRNKNSLMEFVVSPEDEPVIEEFLDRCFPDVKKKAITRAPSTKVIEKKEKKNTCQLCSTLIRGAARYVDKENHCLEHVNITCWKCMKCDHRAAYDDISSHLEECHSLKPRKGFNYCRQILEEEQGELDRTVQECFPGAAKPKARSATKPKKVQQK